MANSSKYCSAHRNGGPCGRPSAITRPVALCRAHIAEVVRQSAALMLQAEQVGDTETIREKALILAARTLDAEHSATANASVVYFLANGERIKIGHSTSVRNRVTSLSLRYSDIRLLLAGTPELEIALHRHFNASRVGDTEWFELAGPVQSFIEARARGAIPQDLDSLTSPARPLAPPLLYPDGRQVADWPDLYRVLARMGSATKDELRENGPYDSRDTVRRALDTWCRHGVEARPDGRTTRYYLPTN